MRNLSISMAIWSLILAACGPTSVNQRKNTEEAPVQEAVEAPTQGFINQQPVDSGVILDQDPILGPTVEVRDETTITQTDATELADVSVTLGAYNLLRLGQSDKDLVRMAKLIDKSEMDVFGAVEIMKRDSADELLEVLRTETDRNWQMMISETASGEHSYREFFGFYYDADVVTPANQDDQFCKSDYRAETGTQDNACYAKDLRTDDRPEFEREPFVGHFISEGKLFTLISVHVYFGDWTDRAVARRRHEMKNIKRVMAEIEETTPDSDIFIVGDFNLELEDDEEGLDETIPSWFTHRKLKGLIGRPTTTGLSSYDHIFYSFGNESKYQSYSAVPVADFRFSDRELRKDYKKWVSDHLPVRATFSWVN